MKTPHVRDQSDTAIGPKPRGSKVIFYRNRREGFLYVEIPPPGWSGGHLATVIFMLLWLMVPAIFFIYCIYHYVAHPLHPAMFIVLPVWIGGLVFCYFGFPLLKDLISDPYTRQILHVGRQTYGVWSERCLRKVGIEESCGDEPDPSRALGETRNLNLAALIPAQEVSTSDGTTTVGPYIEVREGIKIQEFGQDLQLIELEWIIKEINETIRELVGSEHAANMV